MRYKCESCLEESCIKFLDLGEQPICNKFLKNPNEFKNEKKYPLEMMFCTNCKLVQLSFLPPSEEVFGTDFNYLSGATPERKKYFVEEASSIIKDNNMNNKDFILDIGSNDGTLLTPFKEQNINVLGIDPAPLACEIANKAGIKTINSRFEDGINEILKETNGRLKVITAFNVIAHTGTIHEFLSGVEKLITQNKDATFITVVPYLPDLIEKCAYDTVYHEHARYYTITSMQNLFKKHNLFIYDAKKIPLYGGSIFVCSKGYNTEQSENLRRLIRMEEKFNDLETYQNFANKVIENGKILYDLIKNMKKEGKIIVGIGAPMKSSTLLNYCKIDNSLLEYITEVNQLKINTYTPGTHIKVIAEDKLLENVPDGMLILSWDVSDRIIKMLKNKGYNGIFIIPIPDVKVIE
jgi:2-polyprenyl-3-methyl-5-hydroxy-6-metoxy-1,4-benzoquinol methylase